MSISYPLYRSKYRFSQVSIDIFPPILCRLLAGLLVVIHLPVAESQSPSSPSLPPQFVCQLRCTALCLQKNATDSCFDNCTSYNNLNLCSDQPCWNSCKDLGPPSGNTNIGTPQNIEVSNLNSRAVIRWQPVPEASGYVIQYKNVQDNEFTGSKIESSTAVDFLPRPQNYGACDPFQIRIIAISSNGASQPSPVVTVEAPLPYVDPKLNLVTMNYISQPYEKDFYQANGTVEIEFSYSNSDWPLGDEDLIITPSFHMIMCSDPDLSQGIPEAEFVPGKEVRTLVGQVGSDMMYRKCKFLYYVESISSKQCKDSTNRIEFPPPQDLQTVIIQCSTVNNAPCSEEPNYAHPNCGVADSIKYTIIPTPNSDGVHNLTLNVTFVPQPQRNPSDPPDLYYEGIYGPAVNYAKLNYNNSLILTGINKDQLYGLTICAIKDVHNTTLPNVLSTDKSVRPKANPILVKSEAPNISTIAHSAPLIQSESTLIDDLIEVDAEQFLKIRVKRNKPATNESDVEFSGDDYQNPTFYEALDFSGEIDENGTTFEILGNSTEEINFTEQNEGSGLMYKMLKMNENRDDFEGSSSGEEIEFSGTEPGEEHAENCTLLDDNNTIIPCDQTIESKSVVGIIIGCVLGGLALIAVSAGLAFWWMSKKNREKLLKFKMSMGSDITPRYTDMPKKLVNMLACITDSEPLCLIVEYCSDGDLLHFLRDRCKYMMKLDELKINYHECPIDDNYDPDMIVTLKQLLMFAVQVSYGLEYLSQKGYIHRDVAARNVLVHEKNACKIGDFGLCRYIYSESPHYKSKLQGGRLPLKWMSPEAIRHYEFSSMSDVWSFGVLLFEIITLGGTPYPGIQPEDMLSYLEEDGRMDQPDNCPDDLKRKFPEDYSYLKLDAARDYYNVTYEKKPDTTIVIHEINDRELEDVKDIKEISEIKEPKEIEVK
ncbi:hypothetical protein WR25_21772 [Diploscapter pachys]|uniref:receptor protein-tyrosine kinase n=1 Tax=Diploscapter pachys TaxID=2018661 RepID=A0A2A2LFG1_9BILA|nr:hypothetical protein WR25_21772 [Diploscapter pachys]